MCPIVDSVGIYLAKPETESHLNGSNSQAIPIKCYHTLKETAVMDPSALSMKYR